MSIVQKALDNRRVVVYVILAAVTLFALGRVESVANEAHDTAVAFERAEQREDAEEKRETYLACQQRNSFQENSREGDNRIIDAFISAFLRGADSPEEQDSIRQAGEEARDAVLEGRTPELEDRDCNNDGVLDEDDYLP